MDIRPTGPTPARIMIVGEFPGEQEVVRGEPFVGYAGEELSRMLKEAGIMRSACFITNVIRVRPPGNDIDCFIAKTKSAITGQHLMFRDKFVLPCVRDGIELLKREIELCRPNVILALGNTAMWALTGSSGIMSWRGSVMECDLPLALDYKPKVIPSYHPALVMRQWNWRPIAIHDMRKVVVESKTPVLIRPDYKFLVRPDFSQTISVLEQLYEQLEATRRTRETKHTGITPP